jgi:hypothetical protein
MRALLNGPLTTLLKRDNHVYRDAVVPEKPSVEELNQQLEGRWQGIDQLSYSRKRGLLQLIMRIQRRSTMENQWAALLNIASEAVNNEPEFTDETEVQAPPVQGQFEAASVHFNPEARALLEELAGKHAYVATVTLAVIERAKIESGILQSSDFLWTRGVDRQLWQMINGYGRPRQFASVVGIFAHFELEKRHGLSVETKFAASTVMA